MNQANAIWDKGLGWRPPDSDLGVSDKRDSNPRPSAWEADALPTELLSHYLVLQSYKIKLKVQSSKFWVLSSRHTIKVGRIKNIA